ncbi:MAG: aminotransferase class V-fold PLP-dependent enzyme [Phaeodactylibacter sp.]|nr:aminotransferase class V-fold PLP-dependent enzyme [Phaeodactylibacter sp.]
MNTTTKIPSARFGKIELGPEAFRQLGYALVDRISQHLDEVAEGPVTMAPTAEAIGEMIGKISSAAPDGQEAGILLENTAELLFRQSLFNGHPKFWGYITSSPTPIGILGDLLASAVNANVGAWALSPVATEIEKQTVEWIGRFMGYPAGGGLMVSGGNMANNVGFQAAIRAKAGPQILEGGLRSLDKPLTAYCSGQTHTWIQKSASLCGLGANSIRWIDTDAEGRMSLEHLHGQIQKDIAAGYEPFLVVGTAGSVSTGVVDPLAGIAEICKQYKLWFHIDGAYGGFAGALPELQGQFKGLESADSIAVDPHKWLYAPLEAGCTLVRDPRHLTNTFSYHPPYYNFEAEQLNYVDYGPQNSRGFRALKVWLAAQHLGMEGYRQLIREDIQLAQYAFELFSGQDDFETFSRHLSIATFRYVPPALKPRLGDEAVEAHLNQMNQAILNRIEAEGKYFISKAMIGGRFALRMCIVNFRSSAEDVEGFPAYVRALGQAEGSAR